MTINTTAVQGQVSLDTFPDVPPRDDMQNTIYLNTPGYVPALIYHFSRKLGKDTTLVTSEAPLGLRARMDAGYLIPDLLIAFDADEQQYLADRGYSIESQGKPPEFVLEIASVSTGRRDDTHKRERYAEFGAAEYWRFDPSSGEYHAAPLTGDRLADGEYRPIEINDTEDDVIRGYSEVLGLYICWEDGKLRWFDPITGNYLRTHLETESEREAAQQARLAERQARIAEQQARIAAEAENRRLRQRLQELGLSE